MVRIRFDADVCQKLDGVAEPVEVCDSTGRVIGLFLPDGIPAVIKRGVPPADLPIPLTPRNWPCGGSPARAAPSRRFSAASGSDEAPGFWSPEADERLQSLIKESLDPGQASRIIREIDFWLARGPLEFGESRFENVCLGVIAPFAVLFEVLDDPATVIVIDVWRF